MNSRGLGWGEWRSQTRPAGAPQRSPDKHGSHGRHGPSRLDRIGVSSKSLLTPPSDLKPPPPLFSKKSLPRMEALPSPLKNSGSRRRGRRAVGGESKLGAPSVLTSSPLVRKPLPQRNRRAHPSSLLSSPLSSAGPSPKQSKAVSARSPPSVSLPPPKLSTTSFGGGGSGAGAGSAGSSSPSNHEIEARSPTMRGNVVSGAGLGSVPAARLRTRSVSGQFDDEGSGGTSPRVAHNTGGPAPSEEVDQAAAAEALATLNATRRDGNTSSVLIVYAGGTIGMAETPDGLACVPGAVSKCMMAHRGLQDPSMPPGTMPLSEHGFRVTYRLIEFDPVLDSCNMDCRDWARIARTIEKHINDYDGFVVLHGTDTMAYTASALSFMLVNLHKTVVITGAQIPITRIRNDAEGNLLGALTIAGHYDIPEVCLYFNSKLMRGNRTSKVDALALDAFDSPHIAPLAEIGIRVNVHWHRVLRQPSRRFRVDTRFDRDVVVFYLYPGVVASQLDRVLQPPTRGCILLSFGSGNAPHESRGFLDVLRAAERRGVAVVNVSQVVRAAVVPDYETGMALKRVGVVPGGDMTVEAALVKLGCLLGRGFTGDELKEALVRPMVGELTRQHKTQFSENSAPFVTSVYRSMEEAGKVSGVTPSDDIRRIRDALAPTLMCSAAARGFVDALAEMINSGADVNTTDYDGRTALHLAAAEGQLDAVKLLLKEGALLHVEDRWGQTPLAEATRWAHNDVSEFLESHGASRAAGKAIRQLARAAYEEDLVSMRRLLHNGADPNSVLYDGRAPLHLVAANGNAAAVELLCTYGAFPNLLDGKNRSPLAMALRYKHSAAADMLRRFGALTNPQSMPTATPHLIKATARATPLERFRAAVRKVIVTNRLTPTAAAVRARRQRQGNTRADVEAAKAQLLAAAAATKAKAAAAEVAAKSVDEGGASNGGTSAEDGGAQESKS